MKKYVWLAIVTGCVIGGIWWVNGIVHPEPTAVSVKTLSASAIERTVMCSGKIQTGDTDQVYMKWPCVAQSVNVKKGDTVKAGDVLFTVDEQATIETIGSAGQSITDVSALKIDTIVKAPISGVVDSISVQAGQTISSTKPCVVISSDERLQLLVEIGERDVKYVRVGQPVHIRGAAFMKERYTGRVLSISSTAIEQYSGTSSETVVEAVVEIEPNDQDESLRLGLTATADIVVDEQENGLVVPYGCVLQDDDGQEYVYVYQNGQALKRVIETGWELRDGFQVVSGLVAGESLITEPALISADAMAVVKRG